MSLFTIFLYKINPWIAVGVPIVLASYSQTIWYAAETRFYSFWLSINLLFIASYISLRVKNNFFSKFSLLFLSILNIATAISSPVITTFTFLFSSFKRRSNVLFWLFTIIINILLFKFWSVRKSDGFSFKYFSQGFEFYFKHFSNHGLDMHGGWSGFLRELLFSLILFKGSKKISNERNNLYISIGAISLAFLSSSIFIYFYQIGVGYFFSERHVIFILAVRALLYFSFAYFILDVVLKKLNLNINYILQIILFFILTIEFLPKNVSEMKKLSVSKYIKSYCHGSVDLSILVHNTEPNLLNKTNELRHSNRCLEESSKGYNFNPEWIYGE